MFAVKAGAKHVIGVSAAFFGEFFIQQMMIVLVDKCVCVDEWVWVCDVRLIVSLD